MLPYNNSKCKVVGASDSGHYQNSQYDIRAVLTTYGFYKGHGTGAAKHSGWNVFHIGTNKVAKYFDYLKDAKKFAENR